MKTVRAVLEKLKVNFTDFNRITNESYASEVYNVKTPNKDLILKFSHSKTKFWRELKTIDYLSNKFPVPNVLDIYKPDENTSGAILMNKISGKPVSRQQLSIEVIKECGQHLAKLHQLQFDKIGYFSEFGFKNLPFETWWQYRKDLLFNNWGNIIKGKVSEQILEKAKSVFNSYYKLLKDENIYLVHCDYRPGNLLFESGSVNGIIDFESTRTGDRSYDFVKFYEEIGESPKLWNSFLNGYKAIKDLPDLENTIPYYELDLNYGFLYWSIDRKDNKLFKDRLIKFKDLLSKY